MKELFNQGGPIILLLLGCSVLAMGIFLERFFHYHRSGIVVQDLLQGVSNLVGRKNYLEALTMCAGTPGPAARVMKSVLMRHEADREDLRAIAQEAGQLEVPRLERYLPALSAICYIAPLIGLLGTLLGMVDTFAVVQKGIATPMELARGIYKSLVTAAAGVGVAIPAFILYSFLASYARKIMHDMERAGIEVVNLVMLSRENPDIVEFKEGLRAVEEKKRKASGPRS